MAVRGLNHFTVRTNDLERSAAFYAAALGLRIGDRPPFPFPGMWLWNESNPVVHLVGNDRGDGRAADPGGGMGRLDHIALTCTDLEATRARLASLGVSFEERLVPRLNQTQLFVTDPDGVPLELLFPE